MPALSFDVHVYHHLSPDDGETLRLLRTIHEGVQAMSQQIETLKVAVANNTVVIDSAVLLLNGLAARIVELKADPVALQALADEVTAKSQALGAAVVEHTQQA